MKNISLVCGQLGSRQRYDIPTAFQEIGWLNTFITDFWSPVGEYSKCISKIIRTPIVCRGLERWSSNLDSSVVKPHNLLGIQRALDLAKNRGQIKWSEKIVLYGRRFACRVLDDLKQIPHNSYYGFCSEALEALQYEKKMNNLTILDQYDAGNDEELINNEVFFWPGWKTLFKRSKFYYDRVYSEWSCADLIIVNSSWTKKSIMMQGAAKEKIFVVPQIYRPYRTQTNNYKKERSNPLRVLYVGVVSLRKGVQYLVKAAEILFGMEIEFVIVGDVEVNNETIQRFPSNISLSGHIPYEKVKEYYSNSDVFVFPTLSDGFGRVQLEAMENGLPVIATPNCGEVVKDKTNGFIVPIRNAEAIAACIKTLFDDRELLNQMSNNARNTITEFSCQRFLSCISQAIETYKLKNEETLGFDQK